MIFDYKTVLAGIGIVISLTQYLPYISHTLKGQTKPHAFSWFVWGLPAFIVFAAQLVKGGGIGSWVTAATALMCTLIFVLALFYGEKDLTMLDWVSLFGALVALALWYITKDPLGSVVLVTIADCLGFVPTFRKSLSKPNEETLSTYILGSIKWFISIAALQTFSLTSVLYPLTLAVANWIFAVMVLVLRSRIKSQPAAI